MSGVLAWIKGHLAIVILSAVIVILPATAAIVSSRINAGIRKERTQQVNAAKSRLTGVKQLTYEDIALGDRYPSTKFTGPPHEEYAQIFRERREEQQRQIDEIQRRVVEINQKGRKPILDNVLPEPPGDQIEKQRRWLEFLTTFTPNGRDGHLGTSAYESLLKSIGAGRPPHPDLVAQSVSDLETAEMERLVQGQQLRGEMTAEQKEALKQKLIAQRISEYRRRATEISVYAGMEVFTGDAPHIPEPGRATLPTPAECFQWQFEYWAVEDILGAIKRANAGPDGQPLPVTLAPVKRILALSLNSRDLPQKALEAERRELAQQDPNYVPTGTEEASLPPPVDTTTEMLGRDYSESVTGRWFGASNGLYDLWISDLVLLVDYQQLPKLLEAIASTNFMEVTDVFLEQVDPFKDLREGYFYGESYVVKASLKIELVHFRSWTTRYMPTGVKKSLNVPIVEPPPGEEGGEGPG